jgi:hypothetical protein
LMKTSDIATWIFHVMSSWLGVVASNLDLDDQHPSMDFPCDIVVMESRLQCLMNTSSVAPWIFHVAPQWWSRSSSASRVLSIDLGHQRLLRGNSNYHM